MRSPRRCLLAALLLLALSACVASSRTKPAPAASPTPPAGETMNPVAQPYAEVADKIIAAVLKGNDAWAKLQTLCDDIGHRLSGSVGLEKAVVWAKQTLAADGHENVHTEPVQVPKWVRGRESLTMNAPYKLDLPILGLGGSVGTPEDGFTAEVVVAGDEKELVALGDKVARRILLFNNPMPTYDPVKGSGYGRTVRFRIKGANMTAARGGVATLVRSVTAHSLRTPHTGMLSYRDAQERIPAAAVTTEDADRIARLVAAGKRVEVTLRMEAQDEGTAPSANVIGELRGREKPEELVVIGGHLDSWDVGQGAHDDGTGCVIAMEALSALRRLGLRPRRTIRVVLWTNEENGLAGARAYAKAHAEELSNHVAAIESDSGGFQPVGYGVDMKDKTLQAEVARKLSLFMPLLASLGPQTVKTGFGGADISPLRSAGVPALGFRVDGSKYFDYHHSEADTLDKVDPDELSRGVASMAVMAYLLAELPERLAPAAAPAEAAKP